MTIFCTSWMGYQASHKLMLRKIFLEQYSHFLNFTQMQIEYAAIVPKKIIQKYKNRGEFQRFLNLVKKNLKEGEEFKDSFKKTLLKVKDDFGLEEYDINTILDFSEKLGTSNVTNQIKHCVLHIDFVNKLLKEAEQKRKQMSKIYLVIGTSAGVALSLLLF